MRHLVLTMFLTCLAADLGITQERNRVDSSAGETYELYSWRDSNGAWIFRVLETTNRPKTAEEIFGERQEIRGVDKLKRKMLHLKRHSTLVWFEKIVYSGSPVRGTERLEWPPKEIIEEVRKYGAARHIEVLGPK